MHGLDTVLEGSLDGLDTFFDALSLLWNLTQGCEDLSWHGEVVDLGVVWSATLGVVLVDQGSDELEELLKLSLELNEFLTYWWKVCLVEASVSSGGGGLDSDL